MTAMVTACLLLLAGGGLVVGGVYVLAGVGWALVSASVPFLAVAAVILRGMSG